MKILYLDNHIFALDKPHSLLTQPSGSQHDSLEAQAKDWLKREYSKPGAVFLEAVHRIDKEVCGIVLFARTSKALSRLNASIRNRQVSKIYRALVSGVLQENSAELQDYLLHGNHKAQVVSAKTPGAKLAQLSYKVLKIDSGLSLLEVDLHTGRYHQIRAQLATLGHPIVGDKKYGSKLTWQNNSLALQHYQLSFEHPVQRTKIVLQSEFSLGNRE